MAHLGLIVRLIMLAACLVPFTNIRQVGAILAHKPAAPSQTMPAQQEEDDSEREEQAGSKERAAHPRLERQLPSEQLLDVLPPILTLGPAAGRVARSAPTPLDPFRNGLGSPYRC
jgi:hypothetical protein